ncbi:uracil phosphoribosyltransferase [Candidatus Atelocyanobacterium thalassae]|uniref:uracil phosphoribosyltransferase n=2 Tax=Candidatus Atelocyanobacterium thalassae TaxID=713887 RepID=A0A086CHF5_9CHRO|nr:uracil phosphoribosyltransferase [Candidatus Atelocyanobacterium thalassa]KFF41619.1 MAG: uracil phosphoribosyltransferase [Candidatus Atelocyanobacterium thalassa isolate SIO64986]BDA39294.1 uracil phosphoribosyltransferase [cyanobacterium endosymbiont of Braarudosphaera bigelowii]
MDSQLRVYVPDHPLIKHWLGIARDINTPDILFKTAIVELGRWLTYEATRYWLPMIEATVQGPLSTSSIVLINSKVPIAVIPVLRTGLVLLEGAQTLLPLAKIYHFGLEEDSNDSKITCYLNKLPQQFTKSTQIVILEPVLGTGERIMTTLSEIVQRGADLNLVRIISVVVTPKALQKLNLKYPVLNIYTATIDEKVDDSGNIIPGLGNVEERAFGT